MARRIFIGDIQGCLTQLDALLERLALRANDHLWCVGDLVNRGPDSLGVLRRIHGMGASTVLGNHDITLLRRCATGRIDTLPPLLRPIPDAPDGTELIAWLGRQPVMHVEDDLVVVHAGLHPSWTALETLAADVNETLPAHITGTPDARIDFATQVRHCDAIGRRPAADDPPPGPPYMPWDQWYRGERTVVFGHWARRGLVDGRRVRGLDTGCVYGGALTAWVAEEDRLVQLSS